MNPAYERLRDGIVAGAYAPGQRLTEVALGETLEVSRTPVREALRKLESDGLVRPTGRGVVVVALPPAALANTYAVRAALEALTAEAAATRQRAGEIAPATLAALHRDAQALEEITAGGDHDRAIELNRRFHLDVAALADNPVALEILERLWNQIIVSTRASLRPAHRPEEVAADHRALLSAISEGDAAEAARAARDHAQRTAHTISRTE